MTSTLATEVLSVAVTAMFTILPACTKLPFAGLVIETTGGVRSVVSVVEPLVTVRIIEVVFAPGDPVTVMGYVPTAIPEAVVILRVV